MRKFLKYNYTITDGIHFDETEGTCFSVYDIEFCTVKERNGWNVYQADSGLRVIGGLKTKKEAVEVATKTILDNAHCGADLKRIILKKITYLQREGYL